jgi:hypothetical protein
MSLPAHFSTISVLAWAALAATIHSSATSSSVLNYGSFYS